MASGRQRLTFEDFYGDLENSDNDDSHNGETPNQDIRSENYRDNETVEPDLTSGVSNAFGNLLNTFWRLTGLASKPPVLPDPRTPQRNDDVEVLPDLTTPQRNHHVEVLPDPRTPQRNHHVEVLGGPRSRVYRREKYLAERMTVESCPDGDKVKRCEKDVMSLPTTMCKWCGKISSSPLKRCSRCLAVSYCDQQCQKIDLKNHKITCWHLDRYDVARARVYPAVKFFPALRHARDYTLLVEDMPSEIQYENGASCNILVEILGRIRNDFRFSFLVMDLEGKVTRVMVHDDKNVYNHPGTDSMKTGCCLPTWLKPGNFMLVVGTYCRIFKDRLPGIRINDLDSVYFINMEDQEAPKKYKEHMEQFVLMENARLERLLGRSVV